MVMVNDLNLVKRYKSYNDLIVFVTKSTYYPKLTELV